MAEVKITDLVDQSAIDQLLALDKQMKDCLATYVNVAKELAKGLEVKVQVVGDLEKLDKLIVEKSKEAAAANKQLSDVLEQQQTVIANTTNTISRQLMEQERVNKTTREAYTEQAKVKELLAQVNGTYENNVRNLIQCNQAIAANKKAQDDLKKSLDMGRISMDGYNERLLTLTMQERELKQQKASITTLLKNEERENQAVNGSYNQLSQQLELLKKAYKSMTEEEKASALGTEMEAAIQNLDAHLKDLAADMGEFQRNTGNYAVATGGLKKTYDEQVASLAALQTAYNKMSAAEKASQQGQELAKSIQSVSAAAKETKTAMDQQTQALEEAKKSLGDTSGPTQSVKKDLKELVLEIANLTIAYNHLTAEEQASAEGQALKSHIIELTEKAGELKDAIGDTNQAITNAASDTRGFDQVSAGIQLAIDGFGLATGAAEMLGISEGELAEIQTKLQAAIAASNAMQSIQNALQAQGALMQAANLLQTKLRTVAENLHTAAQGKGVIATAALTAAQWAFNAAAAANPIGLVVVAITACIAAVWGLCKAFSAFFGDSEEAVKQYEAQKQALDELTEANNRNMESMKARGATEAELLNQSLSDKQAEKEAAEALFASAQELYDEDEDEYKEALEAKNKAQEDYVNAQQDGLNYLYKVIHEYEEEEKKERLGTYEYKRQLIQAELQQQKAIAATLLAQEKITRQVYENLCASLDKAAQLKIDKVNQDEAEHKEKETKRFSRSSSGGGGGANDPKKAADDLRKEVEAGEDALLKLIANSLERQRQAELLSYNRRLKDLNDRLAKIKDKESAMYKALYNQIQGLTAEHDAKMESLEFQRRERYNKAEADIIESHLAIVEEGTQEEYDWRLKQLTNQNTAELIAIKKAEDEHTLTHEQAEEKRRNIAVDYFNKIQALDEEMANKKVEAIQRQYQATQAMAETSYIQELNALKRRYAEQVKAAQGNTAELTRVREQYEEDCAKLTESYAVKNAKAAIDMIEQVLKTEDLSAEERANYEAQLMRAKAEYETAMADQAIAQINRVTEADQKAKDKRNENTQRWLQAAADSLNAINDLASSIYDAKIQRLEDEQEANTEAGEKEQEQITELVQKKVITEEEGEARKRAAAAKTAKKDEELEKKKAKLKHDQAVWDKANSIAQAGINTAMSITQTAATMGFPAAIPFIAIAAALGALQIATILATPIPKYAKGTDHHKGGLAIVGDGGQQEVVSFGGQAYLTPDKPTLVDIPVGASVAPSIDKFLASPGGLYDLQPMVDAKPQVVVNNDYRRLEEKLDTLIYISKGQAKAQRQAARDAQLQALIISRGL